MFTFDEWLKPHVLGKLDSGSYPHYLLDHYWDQLVVYLLTGPPQWYHLVHLLRSICWDQYGSATKCLTLTYIAFFFILWECTRLIVLRVFQVVQKGEVVQAATSAVGFATELGKKGFERAQPHLSSAINSASELVKKTVDQVQQTASQAIAKIRRDAPVTAN